MVDEHSSPMQRRILCVDDDETMLRLLHTYLEVSGYSVLTEADPRQALATTAAEAIDAVILDYAMPELDGAYVAAEMRRLKPALPIIMFSGSPTKESPRLHNLISAFIQKSEGVPALVTALDKVMGALPPTVRVRRFPRYRVRVQVVLTLEREDGTQVLHGTSTAIGEGGLGCTLDGTLTPGELVSVDLAEPKIAFPEAQVRYRNGNDYGFAFIHTSPAQQMEIRRYCQQLAQA